MLALSRLDELELKRARDIDQRPGAIQEYGWDIRLSQRCPRPSWLHGLDYAQDAAPP